MKLYDFTKDEIIETMNSEIMEVVEIYNLDLPDLNDVMLAWYLATARSMKKSDGRIIADVSKSLKKFQEAKSNLSN